MQIRNVWKDVPEPLELHEDERGRIADIFYKDEINHVAIIETKLNGKKELIRGNHYHKDATQHILMTSGSLEYWYKPVNSKEPAKVVIQKKGDLVSTPPNEIHALRFTEDGTFVVFSQGKRGGKDYEADTFRVDSIVGKSPVKK